MADVKGAAAQLTNFKELVAKGQNDEAYRLLTQLKVKLTEFQALPPILQNTPTKEKECMIARDLLEHSIFLAINMEDDKLFGRNFEQLKAYYTDLHGLLPPSQQEYPILGLNLLRLLAQNRIAEFHVELELLGPEAQGSVHVAFPRQLEQQLMEGLYDKLYRAMQHEKSPHMRVFLSQLQATIRDEAAACAAVAYDKLLLKDAAALLKFQTQQELLLYCNQQGWQHDAQYVHFANHSKQSSDGAHMQTFHNMLMYARELDRII